MGGPQAAAAAVVIPCARPARPPRVIGAVGLTLVAAAAMVVMQFVAGFFAGMYQSLTRPLPEFPVARQAMEDFFTTPVGLAILLLSAQAGVLLTGLLAARFGREPVADQLGVGRSNVGWLSYLPLLFGTLVAALVGVLMAMPVAVWLGVGEEAMGQAFQQVRSVRDPAGLALFLAAVTLGAGVIEELYFRGLIQRRLLRRLRPAWAIGVTSVLFAAIHMHPVQSVFALPVGVWLGVIAWRTNSIWPAVFCHGGLNLIWNAWPTLISALEMPAELVGAYGLGLLAVSMVSFAVSVAILCRSRPVRPAGPSVFEQRPVLARPVVGVAAGV